MKLKDRVERLERELLKSRRGSRMEEVADWIEDQFKKKEIIPTRKLFDKAFKEKGWKYQTLQIARRHMLDDIIGIEHRKGKGWCWVKLDD